MNKQEKKYFDALTKDREENANILEKPSMSGIQNSVVEKYSDQAHFIYELLQNADDTEATEARFVLTDEYLLFAHNGKKFFSISDPSNEDADSKKGELGDINAITSIANSNKTEASIGKFGVGFKSVFQYTQTPKIYDPNFNFKIERFIVPKLLDKGWEDRKANETLFIFPFDHPERNSNEAYDDISDKLTNLSFPLLFLSNLKNIEFNFADTIGLYEKKIVKTYTFNDITAELVCLTQNNGEDLDDEYLWIFSKSYNSKHRYSVGFYTDETGHILQAIKNKAAFCFFPTKEDTKLNFIIHAPFLLTDSREGIRAGVEHNEEMIKLLAKLAADAIYYFKEIGDKENCRIITDDIISIIPYDSEEFSDPNDKSRISFLPFYDKIKSIFKYREIIPSKTGYVDKENAYWASTVEIATLFSDEQLANICDNKSACWVFSSIGRDNIQYTNRALYKYIDDIVKTNINEDAIIKGREKTFSYLEPIKGITKSFIENQNIEWLHNFYKWLRESTNRTDKVKNKSIFLNQNKEAVAAFDEKGEAILFLPYKENNITNDNYNIVHKDLLANEETREFIEDIGVKPPSPQDYIYNTILSQYDDETEFDSNTVLEHFKIIFDYYCNASSEEAENLIKKISNSNFVFLYFIQNNPDLLLQSKFCAGISKDFDAEKFIKIRDNESFEKKCIDYGVIQREFSCNILYFPNETLKRYFLHNGDIKFIAIDEYKRIIDKRKTEQLINFLTELSIKYDFYFPLVMQKFIKNERKVEYCPDGLIDLLDFIEQEEKKEETIYLWELLCFWVDKNLFQKCLKKLVVTRQRSSWNWNPIKTEPSNTVELLKQKKWLVDIEGNFQSAANLSMDRLSKIYPLDIEGAKELLEILGIQETEYANLSEEMRKKLEFANQIEALCKKQGLNESETLEEFQEFLENKQQREEEHSEAKKINNYDYRNRVVSKIKTRIKKSDTEITENNDVEIKEERDKDEYIPATVNYSQRIKNTEKKLDAEISKIANLERLQEIATQMPKYSFGWFKALLAMEAINSNDINSNSKEISISFRKVELEQETKRTLILKHPNRDMPKFMEELADIPISFQLAGNETKKAVIEAVNIKSYTLRVKLKSEEAIKDIDLSAITMATIETKSPAFLLEELSQKFNKLSEVLDIDDNYCMRENLCDNIEFIFGPPGTGKTTHLAEKVILPMMQQNKDCKVLVLTPTNKAADVLVRRIMEKANKSNYKEWLVRFGATAEEDIEEVFKDRNFDIRDLSKNVVITTIARFAYDFFMTTKERIYLDGINWDYIIIDEASMIPIANIIYPLYKKTPKKFIIAGDPFQIEPISSVNLWKDENIYTLVKLNSFEENPQTIPHKYEVKLLTTQYRSIPEIGNIFSKFTYNGILKHYRQSKSQRPLNIEEDIKALNIIKFPVSKYESIYTTKKLNGSNYQIYAALFTYEYLAYISKKIAEANPDELFKIGVISPYRAQTDLIDKLLASEKLPQNIDIQTGTIHGFQGDECDIIFAIFNPPPRLSNSEEIFLNKQNIINVSISRAKDYLFIIMPDDNTEGIELSRIKELENLIKKSSTIKEWYSNDLEDVIFSDPYYLENNTFSTAHQSVNVYGLPERIYEVRTEDNAVDIQIHRREE